MKIAVIGTGYVGLVGGACFAEMGNEVVCVDVDSEKIKKLKKGVVPIYEPGLDPIVEKNRLNGNLRFTTKIQDALKESEVFFIAVGTPMGEDGSADLSYVLQAARDIGSYMSRSLIVVDKSTVPVGTASLVKKEIEKQLKARRKKIEFHVVSNPEFLAQGRAVEDFLKPNRVVIGTDSERVIKIMKELYAPFTRSYDRFIAMDILSAEMTKYAANSALASKISFINEMSNICELVGADINMVRKGIGSDERIGHHFLFAGPGFGGSCFPKDVRALEKLAEMHKYTPTMLNAILEVNEAQKLVMVRKVVENFGDDLRGKIFAVWGLAFKAETDDMRESPAITVIKELMARGAKIQAYDPQAVWQAKKMYFKDNKNIQYAKDKYAALDNAYGLVIMTEWKEFRSPDFSVIKMKLKKPFIFDGRILYDAKKMKELGFKYSSIGRK
jgi:UDPglucose 6-dehydrogenase